MIGNHVFIPGSPAMTLPELLVQAEEGLENGGVHKKRVQRDPFQTPAPKGTSFSFEASESKERAWTKDDWKLLDACFTDQRLDVAERMGLGDDIIADVNDVEIEDVVERFVGIMGGSAVIDECGSAWDR